MGRKKFYGVIVIIVNLVISIWAIGAQAKDPELTVGMAGAMSGTGAQWGAVVDRSCRLAIEDINAKGGIIIEGQRYTLGLKTYDHAYDPTRGLEIAKRMLAVDKVSWIVSHGATAMRPVIPITEENKVIHMTILGGSGSRTFMKQNYTYNMIITAPDSHSLMWEWVTKNHPEWRTTVGMQPDDSSGWEAMKDVKEKILPKFGIKMLADTFYRRGQTDFYPALINLLGAKPDVFDVQNIPPADKGRVIKQAREMGYKGSFISSEAGTIEPVLQIAGSYAEGFIFGAPIDPNSSFATPEEKTFYDKWMKAYGGQFDLTCAPISGGIYIVAQAMMKANSLDTDKINKIIQTSEFDVLGRKVRMGGVSVYGPPPRQVISPYGIYIVEGGKTKMIGTVTLPAGY